VRPANEIDGRRCARLVHRYRRGAVAPHACAAVERLPERVAERREDVFDGVVLVDLEVAAGDDLEVETPV
jgi:hypothetical protein